MGKLKKFLKTFWASTRNRTLLILFTATIAVLAGIAIWRQPEAVTSESGTITHSTDRPDESKKSADEYQWQGAPDEPKKIRIPKIGVDSFVQRAGVDQNNQIAVPTNVHLTSWFADSQKPGQDGLSIIAGHVSGRTTDGIFKGLAQLAEGDQFEVELGNGQILHYKVLSTTSAKASESANLLFSQNPKVRSQLNLITCGGNFDARTNQYEERVIVYTQLI